MRSAPFLQQFPCVTNGGDAYRILPVSVVQIGGEKTPLDREQTSDPKKAFVVHWSICKAAVVQLFGVTETLHCNLGR